MPRVKGGNVARKRRKKILKLAKGYFGSKHLLYKTAHEQVMKSLTYSYRDRKNRKRNFRKLWITRINAASRLNGLSYSRLINGLALAGVEINRKVLADIAVNDPKGFGQIAEMAKKGLEGSVTPQAKPEPSKLIVKPASKTTKKETSTPKKEAPKQSSKEEEVASASPALTQEVLEQKTVAELKEMCKEMSLQGYSALKKAEIIELLLK